jgi:23S rRNA pseudouridine1911/1915/1917 synthase
MADRLLPVPEGLAGMRVDAGLARLLGLSRTAAAALAADGGVELDGVPVDKADRLAAGAWLHVRLPEAPPPIENTPEHIEGMTILYSDDDIVAVDKPPGVAAHATVGWHGPTVLGGLAAAGFRISTSGIHERQGIVHRLDVGTSGVRHGVRARWAGRGGGTPGVGRRAVGAGGGRPVPGCAAGAGHGVRVLRSGVAVAGDGPAVDGR